jgi:HTH-type transcriptional regulator/antitoxin HipB
MKVHNARAIGAIVRERRHELGLDQQSFASRIGASRYWVVQMEQGKEGAEIGRVLRALEALGLSVTIVAPGSPKKSASNHSQVKMPTFDIDAIVEGARRRKDTLPAVKKKLSAVRLGK